MLRIIKKIYQSYQWSLNGLHIAFKEDLSLRIELLCALLLTPCAFIIGSNVNQILWLFFSVHLVIVFELINTSLEKTIDRISTEHHELSGQVKDISSAAVFYTICIAVVVWATIIYCNFIKY